MNSDILKTLPMLRNANNALINALSECLESHIFSPNDNIILPGENLRGAILIARGEVEVLNGKKVVRKMQRFDRYAEGCLFEEKAGEELVRAKTFCEVYLLPREAFQVTIDAQCDHKTKNQMKQTATKSGTNASSKANKMFGSADDGLPKNGYMRHFLPNTKFRKTWDFVILFGLVFYVFSVPLHLMRVLEYDTFEDEAVLLITGYLVDLLFWADLVFECAFFAFTFEGLIVFRRDQVREKFLKTHNVIVEGVAAVPVDLLSLFLGERYLHLLRLTKVVRIPRLFEQQETTSFFENGSQQRLANLNLLLIIVCHWVGCLWWFVASVSSWIGFEMNWRVADETNESLSISHKDMNGFAGYLRSIYWAMVSMSTVGE
jgi:uncharacterized membrane protein